MGGNPDANEMARPLSKKGGPLFSPGAISRSTTSYLEIVDHLEDSRDAIGANTGYIFVGLAVDHPVQGDIAIHDRNADRLRRVKGVFLQARVTVDSPVDLHCGREHPWATTESTWMLLITS